jgi:hypothetical protein
LAEGGAVEIYRGLSDNIIYQTETGEEDYAHQFWVSSVTRTS